MNLECGAMLKFVVLVAFVACVSAAPQPGHILAAAPVVAVQPLATSSSHSYRAPVAKAVVPVIPAAPLVKTIPVVHAAPIVKAAPLIAHTVPVAHAIPVAHTAIIHH
ncbi:hypothetical protein KQX54_009720 [Cotesia glomerata]|uniref:Uncharacterized protein n=2 Tax=Cotesia glomerata TaxID=32391 RepID=A0AAV7I562_COTGL|nr:hypothetical protein KQX54_009720 [Cotesia glomerata]